MTTRKKVMITVSVIATAVLIFAIVMFSIWAGVEVNRTQVDYCTLQKKLADYYVVPTGLENELSKDCIVYFPRPDSDDSKHRYGKYTNLTVRYKYATGYDISLKKDELSGRIFVMQKQEWINNNEGIMTFEEMLSIYESTNLNGIDIFYRKDIRKRYGTLDEYVDIEAFYIKDEILYSIDVSGDLDNEPQIEEYAKYLFEKVF